MTNTRAGCDHSSEIPERTLTMHESHNSAYDPALYA